MISQCDFLWLTAIQIVYQSIRGFLNGEIPFSFHPPSLFLVIVGLCYFFFFPHQICSIPDTVTFFERLNRTCREFGIHQMTHSRTSSNISNANPASLPSGTSSATLADRCKLGRALASQWFTLTIQRSSTNTSTTSASTTQQPSSFLEALKRPSVTVLPSTSAGTNQAGSTWTLTPLVPIDECLHSAILGILRDIAVAGAVLPESHPFDAPRHRVSPPSIENFSSPLPSTPPLRPSSGSKQNSTPTAWLAAASRSTCKSSGDPDAEHWRSIKQKLLQLRTQIRNRDEFDRGLTQLFGDEWRRTVDIGLVDTDDVANGSLLSAEGFEAAAMEESTTSEPPVLGASIGARPRSGSTGIMGRSVTTAPPSPICHPPTLASSNADAPSKARPSMGTSPPQLSVPSGRGTPPPTPLISSRKSPPPSGSTPTLTSTPLNGAAPPFTSRTATPSALSATAPAYHLESKDDMLRRKSGTASLGGSLTTIPPAFCTYGGTVFPSTPTTHHHGSPTPPRVRSLQSSPLIGPTASGNQPMPPAMICPFDFIMVLDFEATCEEPTPPNFLHEIIEFPVVVVDVHLRRICAEFHSFVKPSVNSTLSAFCKQLTGIRQDDVDHAPLLPEVIRRFESWYKQTFPPQARVIFATDGPWDMRDFMYVHSCKRQGIQFPPIFFQWIDVKASFANFFHMPRTRIQKMLEYLGLPLDGRLHSGIDDARNISKIVVGLLVRGCSLCDLDRIQHHHPSFCAPSGSSSSQTTTSTAAPASIDNCGSSGTTAT